MALTKCPECSGDISDHAVTCPKCGYPAGWWRMLKKMIVLQIIVLAVVAAGILALYDWFGVIG